jgi:hypothetical protein
MINLAEKFLLLYAVKIEINRSFNYIRVNNFRETKIKN